MKKSFIVHDATTKEEILVVSDAFCYALNGSYGTILCVSDAELEVAESIREVQSLYEETEG